MFKKICLFIFLFFGFVATNKAQTQSFKPANGMTIGSNYIVFEAEATESPLGKWEIITPSDPRYKNNGSVQPINKTHLEFTGNDHNFGPPTSPLEYKFKCPKTGTYKLGGRLYQRLEGQPDDKCNDVYIRMAGNFTSGNHIPTSVLKQDEKFFGRGVDKWGAFYNIDSHNHGKADVLYNLIEGEIYTFTVSGRAQRTNVDYWIIYENSLPYTIGANTDIAAANAAVYRPVILNCESFVPIDFDVKSVNGFTTAQTTNIEGIEILQVPNQAEWSAVQLIFRGNQGNANFTLNTMLEYGGESIYRLKINGQQIAEVINDRIYGTNIDNYTIQSHHIYENVLIKKGDTIQIEFNRTSNSLVNSNDSTKYSSGILESLEICSTGKIEKLWRIQHPVIWTSLDNKTDIDDLINNYSWASGIVSKAKSAISSKVNTHISNPNSILNTIPALATDDNLSESQASSANSAHAKVLNYASYAAMVYYITGEEKYAQFAADILWYYIEELAPRSPENTAISGNDFYDPRCGYAHFAIAYDFLYNYLKLASTKVYQKSSGTMVAYDHSIAQKAVYNIAMNALHEHGGTDKKYGQAVSNHPILRAPGVLFNILCVDDDIERERMFDVFWNKGTMEQNSFTRTILPMFGEQGIWPEAVSYSFMPNVTLVLNIVDRLKPELNVMDGYTHILDGNFLFDNLRHPNRRFVRYGDSHRDNDGTGALYRYTLNLASRRGFDNYVQKAKVALRQSYDSQGGYNPSAPISTFDNYGAFEQLFWGIDIPNEIDEEIDFQKPTVIIKHAGVALQRNYVDENNSEYGLCGIIGGAHYVHSHCTGITMELYGSGYIMAANAGLPETLAERKEAEHTNYFWRHAGNNTIVVNGNTHGIQPGSWNSESYLWQNTTINLAAEPKHLEDPISPKFSFATQYLGDKVNNCEQMRTLSTIRTSETTGYYFDMFRSESRAENKFHDYIYHNIGDNTIISSQFNEELSVSSTNRYQNDIGDPVKSPGWRFFEDTKVTAPYSDAVKIQFMVNYNNRYMNMYIPGGIEREYTKALGPATREAKNGYDNKKTQIIAIRQQGEAFNKPYVVVFESGTQGSSSIVDVKHLYSNELVVGALVQSKIGDKTIDDYIISLPIPGTVTIPDKGITFTGRFAIIRYEQDMELALSTLYIGEGDSLKFADITLTANENRKGILEKSGKPDFGRILLFKNLKNNDVIPKGSNLNIEATVGDQFTEVTLWANDTINLGTISLGPFIWTGHSILTNMLNDTYTFKLIAKDEQGNIKEETIVIETPSQKPYPNPNQPHQIPGQIQFEEYDSGGENLGFYDKTAQDTVQYSYREDDKVDLGRNGTIVSKLENGEWLEFTIDVLQTGFYSLSVRHQTLESPSINAFDLLLPNTSDTLLKNCNLLYTGRGNFYDDELGTVLLNQGRNVLRFSILNSNFDLDYFNLTFVSAPFQINYEAENGMVIINPQSEYYASGSEITLTAIANNGFEFKSWSGDYSDTSNPLNITLLKDLNIIANFERKNAVDKSYFGKTIVSPNPNFGSFTIKLTENKIGTYTLLTLNGIKIFSEQFFSETNAYFNPKHKGIYLLEVKTDKNTEILKLIVE